MDTFEFNDALKDSPKFRYALAKHEEYFNSVEDKIKSMLRCFEQFIDNGHCLNNSFQNALLAMSDLTNSCFQGDSQIQKTLCSANDLLSEFGKIHKVLIEQCYWSIVKNLNDFLKRDFNKLHDMRNHFQKVSQSLDEALVRNAQISKNKEQEGCEARNELTAVGTCFAHTALDYVFQLNALKIRQKSEITEAIGGFLGATGTYCQQAYDLLFETGSAACVPDSKVPCQIKKDDVVNFRAKLKIDLGSIVNSLKQQSRTAERKMQDRHLLVPKEIFQHPLGMPTDADVVMEGYLFKRATNAFKTWSRRWFAIKDNKLMYCHRDIDYNQSANQSKPVLLNPDDYTVMETDLRLCLVRPAQGNLERRNCFELVTPNKIHVLQADSESLCNAWIKALQRSIESALHDSHHEKTLLIKEFQADLTKSDSPEPFYHTINSKILSESLVGAVKCRSVANFLCSIPGNELCADCGAFDPKWASINLGVTLCIECCAIHRSMGVQVSKVRSLTLDAWEPEHVRLMELLGNNVVNRVYLAHLPAIPIPLPAKKDSSRMVRESWIKTKYLSRKFVRRKSSARFKLWLRKRYCEMKALDLNDSPINVIKKKYNRAISTPDNSRIIEGDKIIPHCHSDPNFRQYFEAERLVNTRNKCEFLARLNSSSSDSLLEARGSVANSEFSLTPENQLLHESSRNADLKAMCRALALGACVNFSCLGLENSTCLHEAVISGSLEACEYLLLNGAKINVQDSIGRTPLHLACQLGHTAQVCQFLKRGANQDVTTVDGRMALDLAMESPNADIVTLLRLAKLNEEIKEADVLNPGDETFADVVRDFSHIATNRPEALIRDKN